MNSGIFQTEKFRRIREKRGVSNHPKEGKDMSMGVLIWLGILIVMLLAEAATVGLATIWFAAGALVAMIAAALGVNVIVQLILFFAVSIVLLYYTRPIALRYFTPKKIRTNYENALDKTVKVTERVDNANETGTAVLNGQEWTARAKDDAVIIEAGQLAKVTAVEGVKLILVPQDSV